ncbi:hypothetical protein D9M68_686650 [compost metagenome]
MGQDAEGVLAAARQRDFEHAVVHVAVGQPEVARHALHQLAELHDGGVVVLGDLFIAHGAQRHHLADGVDHRRLVAGAVVDAQQAADIDQVVASQRRPGLPGGHGRGDRRFRLGSGCHEGLQVGRRGGAGAADQRVERRLLQGLRLPRVRDQQR